MFDIDFGLLFKVAFFYEKPSPRLNNNNNFNTRRLLNYIGLLQKRSNAEKKLSMCFFIKEPCLCPSH